MSSVDPVVITDYGVGNVASVANMFRHVGADCVLSREPDLISRSRKIVLPGVGAFDAGIASLRSRHLDVALKMAIGDAAYVLGICLGAQLLLDASEEGQLPGLGLVAGTARRFRTEAQGLRVPHMGWNVVYPKPGASLFDPAAGEQRFYFAHSFYLECVDPRDIAATCHYGSTFACATEHERVLGVQFHPEKSHRFGMALFRRFADLPC